MMGNKKLNIIVEQLKKQADPIESLEARLSALQKQKGKPSLGNKVRESLTLILKLRTETKKPSKRQALRMKP